MLDAGVNGSRGAAGVIGWVDARLARAQALARAVLACSPEWAAGSNGGPPAPVLEIDLRSARESLPSPREPAPAIEMLALPLPRSTRVLAIMAHPDDFGLAAASAAFSFPDTCLVTMTRRRGALDRTLPGVAEGIAAGVACLWMGDDDDGRGPEDTRATQTRLLSLLEEVGPHVVITHTPCDPHPAHRAVSRLARGTARMLAPCARPDLWYSRPPAVFSLSAWRPEIFFSLSPGTAMLKTHLIQLHPTEKDKRYYNPADHLRVLRLLARVADPYSHRRELEFCEAFERARAW